jgi:general stress protein 26
MTPADLLTFVRRSKLAVVSTTSSAGAPQAAVVGIAVTDALEIVFDTLETSRKAVNLRRDARIALVIGWDEEQTVQCEGIADEPAGAELERIKAVYIATFPDGVARQSWPGLTYFRVRLRWARYSDFRTPDSMIVELGELALSTVGGES